MCSLLQIPKDGMCLVSQMGNGSLFRMTKYEIKIVSVKSQIILQGKSLFLVCVKWISKEQCTEPYNKLLKTTGIKERFEAVHTK